MSNLEQYKGPVLAELMLPCRAMPLKRGRSRGRKYKGMYQPLGDQQEMMDLMKPHFGLLINCWMIVEITCYYRAHQHRNDATKEIQIISYDVDNLMKGILDNMQRMAIIKDDRMVLGCSCIKCPGNSDTTAIKIWKAQGV